VGIVLNSLSQQLGFSPLVDDVSLDSSRFGDVVLPVDQIREVGEVKTQMDFVFLEPFIRIGVMVIFETNSRVGQEQTRGLSQTSNSPIRQLNLRQSRT